MNSSQRGLLTEATEEWVALEEGEVLCGKALVIWACVAVCLTQRACLYAVVEGKGSQGHLCLPGERGAS